MCITQQLIFWVFEYLCMRALVCVCACWCVHNMRVCVCLRWQTEQKNQLVGELESRPSWTNQPTTQASSAGTTGPADPRDASLPESLPDNASFLIYSLQDHQIYTKIIKIIKIMDHGLFLFESEAAKEENKDARVCLPCVGEVCAV